MPKLPCINVPEELKKTLDQYNTQRNGTIASTVRAGLELLFSLSLSSGKKEEVLKETLEEYFSIPKKISLQSFYIFLYMLARNYGEDSSKEFWGEIVYLSESDKSHVEIFTEIQNTIKERSDRA